MREWWLASAGVLAVGLSLTPGLAGHAGTGIYTGFAIPADAIHVLAMACWLGGLVMLLAVVLPRTDPAELRQGINRYSALALGSIVALVVTGGFQAWRQVGSFNALRDTDYGKLLIVKLVVFAALIVAAAFSREVVNRRFRMPPDDEPPEGPDLEHADEAELPAPVVVPVGVGAGAGSTPTAPLASSTRSMPTGNGSSGGNGHVDDDDDTTSGTRTTTRRRCDDSGARSAPRW